jgi:NAD(P)-dependent dehydrogenase (short-subunit alcohol dehydrogenase family)
MSIDFAGQVVVVTGAGRGLGRLFALEVARLGAKVVVNDLGGSMHGAGADMSVADAVVREIVALGGSAVASHESVATPEGASSIVRTALERFGRVDAVVSNAGIFSSIAFENLSVDDWRRMLSVHLDGGFYLSQAAFRVMKEQGYGRFVFMSSSAGVFGQPLEAHYAAAKTGLLGLTNVIALEGAAHGIYANTVLPFGFSRMVTETIAGGGSEGDGASHPFLQAIVPELVVPIVVFLASRECSATHQNYSACAGRFARVFVGLAEGWLAERGSRPSADDIAAHFDAVSATEPFTIPESIFDEIGEVSGRIDAVSGESEGDSKQVAPNDRYSIDTKMSFLLDDPKAKELLSTFIPEIKTAGSMLKLARGMTLRKISGYPQAKISAEKLMLIDAELARLAPAVSAPPVLRRWWQLGRS